MVGIPLFVMYLGLRSKNLLLGINLIISVSLIIILGLAEYYKNGFTQIVSMFLFLLFFALAVTNLISIFVRCWDYGASSLVPIGITIATVPLIVASLSIGRHVNLYIFNKRLPQFENAVKLMESRVTDERIRLRGDEIPKEYRHLAKYITGEKLENGSLAVTFLWGGGFPLKHIAYAYISNGRLPEKGSEFRKNWYRCTRINDNWFRVSD